MQMNQLREAREFALKHGVKSLVYGPPGSGKTPIVNTAPSPVFLAVEPGLMSMRGSTVPTWVAPTWVRIKEFFDWFFGSAEVKNFHTLATDSVSQICEIHLRDNPGKTAHGLPRYGKMAEDVGDILHKLYYMEQKHMYLICKQAIEKGENGKKKAYFPGNDLDIKVPHLFDLIMQIDTFSIPGVGPARAFQCHSSFDSVCRDRSGTLNQFEPPVLADVFNKVMTN